MAGQREAHELLLIEEADAWFEYLEATRAQEYVSANVGCIAHLQSGTATPMTHWIELVDRALAGGP